MEIVVKWRMSCLKIQIIFILKNIESTFPKHTHTHIYTHLVCGRLVSGNILFNILKFDIIFLFKNMRVLFFPAERISISFKDGERISFSFKDGELVFPLRMENFEATLRILANKRLFLYGYFLVLSPESCVEVRS